MPESSPLAAGLHIEGLDTIVAALIQDLQSRGQTPELPTGIPLLDQTIWGLHRAELMVLAGRPGEGKTTLAIQICRHLIERQKRVLFVSMEMTRQQIAERLLVQMTQFDAWHLRTGVHTEEFITLVTGLRPHLDGLNLRIVDRCGYTIAQMQHLMHQLVTEGGGAPDVLIIDFVQLIRLEGGMQRFDAIAEYLIALKELAMEHNMAILICSQINREGIKQGQQPKLENLKSSGAIEELADCVVMSWWEELGKKEQPAGMKYWLLVKKNRYGSPGDQIPVRFDKAHLTFHALDDKVEAWQESQVNGKDITLDATE